MHFQLSTCISSQTTSPGEVALPQDSAVTEPARRRIKLRPRCIPSPREKGPEAFSHGHTSRGLIPSPYATFSLAVTDGLRELWPPPTPTPRGAGTSRSAGSSSRATWRSGSGRERAQPCSDAQNPELWN